MHDTAMQLPIPRLPDSLVLEKYEKIAEKLAKQRWRVDATGDTWSLFSLESKAGEKSPYKKNAIAQQMLDGAGVVARQINLQIDGRHIAQINRPENAPQDSILINQQWWGDSEEMRLAFAEATNLVGSEFIIRRTGAKALGVSDQLSEFVESRDQSLARLEDLQARLMRELVEDREKASDALRQKEEALEKAYQSKLNALEASIKSKSDELGKQEIALGERLKVVDDRESKHARRKIQGELKEEIKKRQSIFGLTAGTRHMRQPIIIAVGILAAVLAYAFYVYTTELVSELGKNPPVPTPLLLAIFARQIVVGGGLMGCIWYFVHWQNQWFQRHADEEFRVKRLELDLDRASWVVELAMEWSKETNGKELPPRILTQLTQNLFAESPGNSKTKRSEDPLSLLFGASSTTEIEAGGAKFTLSRAAAKRLKGALEKSDDGD